MRIFTLLIILSFIQTHSFCQDQVMALRQSREQGFLFIDMDGQQLFSLPADHNPSVREIKEPFKLGNFYKIDFSKNVLPVKHGEHYYLINREGEKIRQLKDSLNWVSPFRQGFFRAYARYQGQKNASWIIYLDKNGDECFDGKRFWQGSQFRKGHAIVQHKSREGEWFMIDSLGKTLISLTDSITGSIRSYKWTKRGLWQLTVKIKDYQYRSVYVRPTDGAISTKPQELLPPVDLNAISILPNTGLEVDPRIRKKLNDMPFMSLPEYYQNQDYGIYLFREKSPKTGETHILLYDHQHNIIPLPQTPGVAYTPVRFFDRFLTMKKVHEGGPTTYVFVDTRDMSQGLELDILPYNIRVEGDLLFYETNGTFDWDTVHKIIHLSGKTIYEPSIESTVFTSLDAALAYKDQARELHLSGVGLSFIEIRLLPNLEVLKIDKGFGGKFPRDILSTLKNLRSLSIRDCEELAFLPADMKDIPKLTHLFISDCPALKGLEELIPQLPALRKLRTDYSFDQQKLQEIKAGSPELKIEFLLVEVQESKD